MTPLSLANRIFAKLAALLFLAAFTVVLCHAQADIQIMVNGPWVFAVYPDSTGEDRLFLVAPSDETHIAYFWSGPNASMRNWMDEMGTPLGYVAISSSNNGQNVYSIDVPNYLKSNQAPDEEYEVVYQSSARVPTKTIQSVVYKPGIVRYAISLPVPDYVRSYSGDYGSGFAEAKVDKTSPTSATIAMWYSTWTVLHYGVSSLPPQLTMTLDGTAQSPIKVTGEVDNGGGRSGITIALMEAPLCANTPPDTPQYYPTSCGFAQISQTRADDTECDKLSGRSFALSAKLWGLTEYALFPMEQDEEGTQNPGTFHYKACPAYSGANAETAKSDQQAVAVRNLKGAIAVKADVLNLEGELNELAKLAAQSKSGKSAHRPKSKESDTLNVSGYFTKLSDDIKLTFPHDVPLELSDAFYCACVEAKQSSCTALGSSKPPANCPSRLQTYLDEVIANDKGSADCHSPQISINGAIQSQP
jgi:hypothetical protein